MKPFDTQQLLQEARERTGLDDFGEPDFREPFEAFIAAINEGGAIAVDQWDRAHDYILRLLINRLWMAKDFNDHPEILQQKLKDPVVILPLPRTGSTKLQRMMGAADSFQNMLWWHIHMIARIPGRPDGGAAERLEATKEFERWSFEVVPDLVKGHPLYAEEPEEEQILNEETFISPKLAMQFSALGFSRWLAGGDETPVYDRMLMQLKYMQWQHYPDGSRPWLLKSPLNVGKEQHLVNMFGRNFKSICPHRDPISIVCSIAQVVDYYRQMFSHVDSAAIAKAYGGITLAGFARAARRHIRFRDANPDMAMLDIAFDDINQDSLGVLERVYDFLDLDLTDAIRNKVRGWEADGTRNKFKKSTYTPEQFGLTKQIIYKEFEEYLDRFSEYICL